MNVFRLKLSKNKKRNFSLSNQIRKKKSILIIEPSQEAKCNDKTTKTAMPVGH